MGTFKTFAIYAGAIICFGGLIFAGIRMMSGRFQDAVPGLFGAGVLGWGAGWILDLFGEIFSTRQTKNVTAARKDRSLPQTKPRLNESTANGQKDLESSRFLFDPDDADIPRFFSRLSKRHG